MAEIKKRGAAGNERGDLKMKRAKKTKGWKKDLENIGSDFDAEVVP